MKCKDCACYKDKWCTMVTDSPDPDMERDCAHITREQVEKMRGKWIDARYSSKDVPQCQCSICGKKYIGLETDFCQYCGAPMTDKAVDILWKRLEAMQDEAETV